MFELQYRQNKSSIKEAVFMTGWNFFFVLVGVCTMTAQLFHVINTIEGPAR